MKAVAAFARKNLNLYLFTNHKWTDRQTYKHTHETDKRQ